MFISCLRLRCDITARGEITSKKIITTPIMILYREGNDVVWNQSDAYIDLNTLPIPDFDPFYEELSQMSKEVQHFFLVEGRLPVEISRGCWWNKCTFCNMNIQHKTYKEKNVDKIIEEIRTLSDKYKVLAFQLMGNT